MKLDRIILREIGMPLVSFFETSFGRTTARRILLAEVRGEGACGWGECVASENPFYSEETTETARHIIRDFIAPRLLGRDIRGADQIHSLLDHIRWHNMAKSAVETAAWDLEARLHGRPLWRHIGGKFEEIPCGVSIGIQDSVEDLLERVQTELDAGYQRIKLKIKPGWDIEVLARVRQRFPGIRLMADANSAYTPADAARLKELDRFHLMMIEQPLAWFDIVDHARLQAQLDTPICLDESIRNLRLAEQAMELGACRIINIKMGRVGGIGEARRIHDAARTRGIPVWCGGMLESGIGRAHNIALSTLDNFVLPGDVSASKRYWKRDVVVPPAEVTPQGAIRVSERPGIGCDIDLDYIESISVRKEELE